MEILSRFFYLNQNKAVCLTYPKLYWNLFKLKTYKKNIAQHSCHEPWVCPRTSFS